MTRPLLILVHPGSACGSADFNLGRELGRAHREAIARDLDAWDGDILVLDNFLGEETADHPAFDAAIRDALARNAAKGHYAAREFGCDNLEPHTSDTLLRLLNESKLNPKAQVKLTGASYDPDDEHGCINGVYDILSAAGFRRLDVLDSAVPLDSVEDDLEDDLENDAGMAAVTGRRKLLVVVHPGSACGSADFNLGAEDGRRMRAALTAELDAWSGDVCVIDGSLSKELRLRRYGAYGAALTRLLDRNTQAGHAAERRFGCAEMAGSRDHMMAARALIAERGLEPGEVDVTLTGAWHDPKGRIGCVNDVEQVFAASGFAVTIGAGAAQVAEDYDEAEEIVAMFM